MQPTRVHRTERRELRSGRWPESWVHGIATPYLMLLPNASVDDTFLLFFRTSWTAEALVWLCRADYIISRYVKQHPQCHDALVRRHRTGPICCDFARFRIGRINAASTSSVGVRYVGIRCGKLTLVYALTNE